MSGPAHAPMIQALIDAQTEAWNRGDADAWASCFSDDAGFVNIMGMSLHGRAHIAERHGVMFRSVFVGSTSRALLESVTPVGDDTLLLRMELAVSGQRALPPGIVATDRDGTLRTRMLYVLARQPRGGWFVVAAQNTPIVPAAVVSPSA